MFARIVRRPVRALLALVAVAGLLVVPATPAPAGVLSEQGVQNSFSIQLKNAGQSGDRKSFTRFFVPSKGSLKVGNFPGSGLLADCQIRVTVVNTENNQTVVNQTASLTFANASHTFSWNISGSVKGYKMTVTNLGSNEPLLFVDVK